MPRAPRAGLASPPSRRGADEPVELVHQVLPQQGGSEASAPFDEDMGQAGVAQGLQRLDQVQVPSADGDRERTRPGPRPVREAARRCPAG